MPILIKLVAICETCPSHGSEPTRQEFEAELHHDGERGWDSMNGYTDLEPSDVTHESPLPEGWHKTNDFRKRISCPECP